MLRRTEEGHDFIVKTHDKLLVFTALETLGIIIVNLWQVFYIQRILENKRLI